MRRLAWFAGGFGLACLLASYRLADPLFAAAVTVLLLGLTAFLWERSRPKRGEERLYDRRPPESRGRWLAFSVSRRALALLLGCVLGCLWSAGYTAWFRAPVEALAGEGVGITGTVISPPRETSIGGYSLLLRMDEPLSAKVLLYGGEEWGGAALGDTLSCTARLEVSEFIFEDRSAYYPAQGVYLVGYAKGESQTVQPDTLPLYLWPTAAAEGLKEGLRTALDEITAPLAVAVTTGDKSGLSEQLTASLSRTGASHTVVVSGMHVSFLAAVAMLLTGGRRRWGITILPALAFYVLMTGGAPSAVRAVVMQGILLAAPIPGRENDPPTSLLAALLVLLLQNPFAAASVGLQLSFTSVAGIILVTPILYKGMYRPVKEKLKKREGWAYRAALAGWRMASASLSATLGAMLFTQPLIWLIFRQISIVSPLVNLLVLWAVSLLFVGALAVGLLGLAIPGAAAVLALPVNVIGRYIHGVVTTLGSWRLAALDGDNSYFTLWLLSVYVIVGILALGRGQRRRTPLVMGCILLLLGTAVTLNVLTIRGAALTVAALDVGQGSSTALASGGQTALVDCGGDQSDSAGDIAADWFASFGEGRLDLLALTHFDSDHVNGVERLFERMEVAAVAIPWTETDYHWRTALLALAETEGTRVYYIAQTAQMELGGCTLTLYPPMGGGSSNEEGLFLLTTAGEFDVLFTGDADTRLENMLLRRYDIPDIELLVAGHHGSGGSTGEALLKAATPELAMISAGAGNSYGHPAEETLERLEGAGCMIYRTDTMGTVTFSIRSDGYAAQTER